MKFNPFRLFKRSPKILPESDEFDIGKFIGDVNRININDHAEDRLVLSKMVEDSKNSELAEPINCVSLRTRGAPTQNYVLLSDDVGGYTFMTAEVYHKGVEFEYINPSAFDVDGSFMKGGLLRSLQWSFGGVIYQDFNYMFTGGVLLFLLRRRFVHIEDTDCEYCNDNLSRMFEFRGSVSLTKENLKEKLWLMMCQDHTTMTMINRANHMAIEKGAPPSPESFTYVKLSLTNEIDDQWKPFYTAWMERLERDLSKLMVE